MKINGQPIYQYDNVKAEVRLGNVTQTAITGFSTTKKEYIQGITVSGTTPSTSAVTFTGTGLDDMTVSGTSSISYDYIVQIDAAGTPDTFEWSDDGGTTWNTTGVAITGTAQLLIDGISVTFAATTGHTVGDNWSFSTTATPFLYTTPESDFDSMEVDIVFPQGLWHTNDRGGLDNNTVHYRVSYSIDSGVTYNAVTSSTSTVVNTVAVGRWSAGQWGFDWQHNWVEESSGSIASSAHTEGDVFDAYDGSWWRWIETTETVNTASLNDYAIATKNATASITQTIKFPVANQTVLLKVEKLTLDRNSTRYGDTMQVGSIREVYDDAFTYPYHVLVGIKALATSKLSGSFDFSCVPEGKLVNVFDGTNWNIEYSTNPAWICWDNLTQPVIDGTTIVKYRGIDANKLLGSLTAFKSWADYCDELVTDGTKRCTFNGIYDTNMSLWEMAMKTCDVGRANLIYNGTLITVIVDRPALNTRPLVTIGSTSKGSFKEHFISAAQKIGKIAVDYLDSANDFDHQQVTFSDSSAGDLSHSATLQVVGIKIGRASCRERV